MNLADLTEASEADTDLIGESPQELLGDEVEPEELENFVAVSGDALLVEEAIAEGTAVIDEEAINAEKEPAAEFEEMAAPMEDENG